MNHHRGLKWTLGDTVICNAARKPLMIALNPANSPSDARVLENTFPPSVCVSDDSGFYASLSYPKLCDPYLQEVAPRHGGR